MREFQDKHKMRRRVYSKTSIAILIFILILMTRGVMNVYAKEKTSRSELERVKKQEVLLQGRHAVLEENSNRLKTPEGVEAEIRSKFDVTKDGEQVIVVVDKKIQKQPEDDRGVIKKFWDSVKGVFVKKTS